MKSKSHIHENPTDRWLLFVKLFFFMIFVVFVFSLVMGLDTAYNLALNLTSEAIGTFASILFIQTFLDKTNQKEAGKTNRIIKSNFEKISSLIEGNINNDKPPIKWRKKRYSHSECSKNNKKRFSKQRHHKYV